MTRAKSKAVAPVPEKREPTERELAVGREAQARILARPKRPQVVGSPKSPIVADAPHNDIHLFRHSIADTFGTTSDAFVNRSLSHLSTALQRGGAENLDGLNAGLAVVAGVKPENEVEAMLAIQMAATHEAALSMLSIARSEATVPAIQAAGGLAVKLLRTFTAQTEALAKLRRKGEQTMRVEHVHIHPGAQAVVGQVAYVPGGGGGILGNCNQPHEAGEPRALVLEAGSAMWSPEPGREAMPASRIEGEDAVSSPRRRSGKRSA